MFSQKKTWNLIGMLVGSAILICGIIFAANPPETYSTDGTDYATFGGDFYTYEYDATRVAARNAAVTANNIRELGSFLAHGLGAALIAAGALTIVCYGKKFCTETAAVQKEDIPEPKTEAPAGMPLEAPEEGSETEGV